MGRRAGAKLLSHAICELCRLGFNARTAKSNTPLIRGYLAVVAAAAVATFLTGP